MSEQKPEPVEQKPEPVKRESVIGTVEQALSYDNPIYMLCDFESYITCYPDECKDFVTSIMNQLDLISVQIFNEDIKPNLRDSECDFVDEKTVETGRAFEIEGFVGGDNCYDCQDSIKLVSNNYCGDCFEIDSFEIGLKVIINEGEDACTHKDFVLSTIPFSIDSSETDGLVYDVNRPEHHIDLIDQRGTTFITRFLNVECQDPHLHELYIGQYEYMNGGLHWDGYPVFKHYCNNFYITAYPSQDFLFFHNMSSIVLR